MNFFIKNNKILISLLVSFFVLSISFRYQIYNEFSYVSENNGDAIIELSILQHWYNFIFHGENFWNTTYFYPHHRTIGFNDGFFVLGIIYSVIHFFIQDPFLSMEFTSVFSKEIGFLAFLFMCQYVLKIGYVPSMMGAALFVLWNALWLQTFVHAQLLTIYFLPFLLILLKLSYINIINNKKNIALCSIFLTCTLYGALMMTGFYISWYFTFFLCEFLLFYIIFNKKEINFREFMANILRRKSYVFYTILFFLFCMSPFFYIYLPAAHETGMHSWQNVKFYIPSIWCIFQYGSGNLIYGFISHAIIKLSGHNTGYFHGKSLDYNISEFTVGITPAVILCIIIFSIYVYRKTKENCNIFWSCLLAGILSSTILAFGFGHIYAWHLVYDFVPGAKGMRVVSRFAIFLALPVSIAVTGLLNILLNNNKKISFYMIGFFILIEQINTAPTINIYRPEQNRFYNSIPMPPRDCRSFFMIDVPPDKEYAGEHYDLYHANIIAMLYSELIRVPTVNGFSTFTPRDWNFSRPYRQDIIERSVIYAKKNHIEHNFCSLNMENMTWKLIK